MTKSKLKKNFPNPRADYDQGVIAVGGVLNSDILIEAYEVGVFPWPHEGYPMLWFCPEQRGVIDQSEFHIPQSLLKWARKNKPQVHYNTCFSEVIKNCKNQLRYEPNKNIVQSTWITDEMLVAYNELFKIGRAYSVEVYLAGELSGGLYGVHSKYYSTAESMFYKKSNCSKWALACLFQYLQQKNQNWVDIQMVTPTTASFGGKYISKAEFLDRISIGASD